MSYPDLHCSGDARRRYLRGSERFNGIDFVEVEQVGGRWELRLYLLRSLPSDGETLFARENVRIEGGSRITDLAVVEEPVFQRAPDPARDDVAILVLDKEG